MHFIDKDILGKSFVMKLFSCQYESEICLIIIMTTYDKPQQPKFQSY